VAKIPVYKDQASFKTPSLGVPAVDSFGKDVAEASAKRGIAIGQMGEKAAAHALQLQETANKKAVLDADTQFRLDMQGLLYNDKADENGRPKGIYSRQLGHASGTTVDFDSGFQTVSKKYEDGLGNGRQKQMFRELAQRFYVAERESVVRHEAAQFRESFARSLDSNIKQRIADVTKLTNPVAIGMAIEEARQIAMDGLKEQGMDDASIKLAGSRIAGEMAQKSVASLLDKDFALAKAIAEKLKPGLSGEDAGAIDKMTMGRELLLNRQATWGAVQGFRYGDGMPDVPKMEAYVKTLNLQPEEHERTVDYIRGQASKLVQDTTRQWAAQDNDFMNNLYALKKDGATLDDALKLVGTYGRDAYDSGVKEAVIKKLYAAPGESNPSVYISLWEGVQENRVSRGLIDKALNAGHITVSDWESLRKDLYKNQIDGGSPAMKDAWEHVKILAENKISNSKKRKMFLYVIQQESRGKAPGELSKLAADKLKDAPGWGTGDMWNVDWKKNEVGNTAVGALYEETGAKRIRGADGGDLGTKDMNIIAERHGGYNNIKPGTKVYEAIQYLINLDEPVSSENINDVFAFWEKQQKEQNK
jgi:hypothetical protein